MALIIPAGESYNQQSGVFNKRYFYPVCFVVALGGLLFGFDLVIISGAVQFFSVYFELNDMESGWAVGSINLGAALGAIVGGRLSDRLGRKKLLILCAFLFALTGFGTGWSESFTLFIIFRILGGVAMGIAVMTCPIYIAEISPASLRGKLVALYQLAVVIGLLLAYLSNYLLLETGPDNWRWMLTSQSLPALFFFAGMFTVFESPRWLIGKGKEEKAFQILKSIGQEEYAKSQFVSIQESFRNAEKENLHQLFSKDFRYVLITGVVIAVFSQAVGQNSIFSYAPVIFHSAGDLQDSGFLQSVVVGIINFLFTYVAILTIDKIGRRRLLMYGAALLGINMLGLAATFFFDFPSYWALIFVLGFVAVYAATVGAATWVILSEIFPNKIRGYAMSFATLALWIANFFTTASFPLLKGSLGLPVVFGIHAAICFAYFFFVFFKVPETKGRSLEEIEKLMVRNKR